MFKKWAGRLAAFSLLCLLIWIPAYYTYSTYGNVVPVGRIVGNSMLPAYHPGEAVIYYTLDKAPAPIGVGSVIIYSKNLSGALVVHRVVSIEQDGTMITKGDNNPGTDQEMGIDSANVTHDHIMGVVAGPLEI